MKKSLLQRLALWILRVTRYQGLLGNKYEVKLDCVPCVEKPTRYDINVYDHNGKHVEHVGIFYKKLYFNESELETIPHKPDSFAVDSCFIENQVHSIKHSYRRLLNDIVHE